LIAFASVMKSNCLQINPKVHGRLVDTCGTGGDKIKTFNISTAAAFVIAGAGIPVAKHGNRSVTSKCGSADLLELFGLNLNLEPNAIKGIIEKIGIGFLFAPAFHPAMKYAAESRREIGIRTVFNVLGPLTNPASAAAHLLGVYDRKLIEPMAQTLSGLGCEQAMVVHGLDGLDEISTVGKTAIAYLTNGTVTTTVLSPKDLGLKQSRIQDLETSKMQENAEAVFRILSGIDIEGAKVDIVLANSAAGIILGGKACDFEAGIEIARESILSGAAYGKLKALLKASDGKLERLEEFELKYA
jgi:anthranilate phosphoribosyltransferase